MEGGCLDPFKMINFQPGVGGGSPLRAGSPQQPLSALRPELSQAEAGGTRPLGGQVPRVLGRRGHEAHRASATAPSGLGDGVCPACDG